VYLILSFLGENSEKQKAKIATYPIRKRPIPFCCGYINPAHKHFLWNLKCGALQYVVVRPLATFFAVIMEYYHHFCPESLSPKYGRVYFLAVNFISVTIAMYTLILLYIIVKEDIRDRHPVLKFLSIKFVIFFR